ncbi:acyl carrier protein [Clostridium oryzae]|uniref:Acyl carrier protein n=1 Tax=Clostridium oryzae TaxID=1450648 RepID=A0A1V4IUJ7_9CLOT|nr:acyl carrier protein [Clostridium oryzae]OPJ63606.1 acyl carrier protein [Clostridium oryzae]
MVLDKIKEIITNQLGIEGKEITVDTVFQDLGVDSLDLFKIIIEVEEAFNVRIEDTDNISGVRDLIEYIEGNKESAN